MGRLSARVCEADWIKKDWIPIIIGACLAGLVLFITIAYLITISRKPTTVYTDVDEQKASGSDSDFGSEQNEKQDESIQVKF